MRALLQYFIFRDLKIHATRSVLTIAGIALGVAAFVSMILINQSLLLSFERAIDAVAGKAKLEVTGPKSGFSESILDSIRENPDVKSAIPVLETTAFLENPKGGALLVLGIDPFSDTEVRSFHLEETEEDPLLLIVKLDSILLSQATADRLHVKVGDKIELSTSAKTHPFTVRGLLKLEGPVKALGGQIAVMDIVAAQIAFGKEGKLDRIDIVPRAEVNLYSFQEDLQQKIGVTLKVGSPKLRSQQFEKNLFFLRMTLFTMGVLSIFVGIFLIFNTMSTAIVQRRHEIGILRGIGATRRSILGTICMEALLYGIIGSGIGLFLGVVLAKGMIQNVTGTVSAMYTPATYTDIRPSVWILFIGFSVGAVSTLLSGLYPAIRAAQISPLEAIREYGAEKQVQKKIRYSLFMGVSLFLTSIVLARFQPQGGMTFPIYGTISLIGILLSLIFLTPSAIKAFAKLARFLSLRFFEITTLLAAENLPRRSARTAVTVTALAVSLSIMTHISILLQSLRRDLNTWIEDVIPAELFVTSGSTLVGPLSNPLTLELAEELQTLPEVEAINRVRLNRIDYQGDEVVLGVLDLKITAQYHEDSSVSKYYVGGNRKKALEVINSNEPAVLISENFSQKYGPKTGETLVLKTPKGERSFKVAGVMIDYTSEQGVVYVDWSQYLPLWEDPLAESFNMYLKPHTNAHALREKILARWGNQYPIIVTTKKEFHKEATTILDQSFGAAHALQIVALMIALVGIVNTLLAAVLERTREIGVLRALGGTRAQCRQMILTEALMMGILGSVMGIASGSTTAAIDLFVTTRQMLGMTIHYFFPAWLPVTAISTSILTAVIAGFYPAYRATRIDPVEAMRYE